MFETVELRRIEELLTKPDLVTVHKGHCLIHEYLALLRLVEFENEIRRDLEKKGVKLL